MQLPKRHTLILTAVAAIVLLAIAYSFRAPAVLVDSAVAEKGLLQQVVEEEGRTRFPNRYQVSAPVTGYLSRAEPEPGDTVAQGVELVRINPAPEIGRASCSARTRHPPGGALTGDKGGE